MLSEGAHPIWGQFGSKTGRSHGRYPAGGWGGVLLYLAAPLSTQEKLGASYLCCDPLHRLTYPQIEMCLFSSPFSMSRPGTQGLLAAVHLQAGGMKYHAGVPFGPMPPPYPSHLTVLLVFLLNMFKMCSLLCLLCHYSSLSPHYGSPGHCVSLLLGPLVCSPASLQPRLHTEASAEMPAARGL